MEYNNYQEALANLCNVSQKERFAAVKFFITNFHPEAKATLKKTLSTEKVQYIKINLEKAIYLLENKETHKKIKEDIIEEKIDIDEKYINFFKMQAIDEFSGIVLHELEPKIGIIKVLLEREIDNYQESIIKQKVEDFEYFFNSLKNLRRSVQVPKYKEVNISGLIKSVFHEEVTKYKNIKINFEGSENLIIKTDKYLLSIVLSNAIRNALESLNELSEEDKKKMMISWGKTDVYTWINIMDEGIGLTDTSENAFKLGNTTKSKSTHSGFGLSIIEQAIHSLLGDVELKNIEKPRGAKLTIRLYSNEQ